MKRRESLKTLFLGTVAGATIGAGAACKTDATEAEVAAEKVPAKSDLYGRTPAELEHDAKVMAETYLTPYELSTIAVLCDIILPATPTAGSATEAGVPEFVEFIVKDLPRHQLPLRGGLMWLDSESNRRFEKSFSDLSSEQQIQIVDDIAYPTPEGEAPSEFAHGIAFFNLMRNLTLTGYYTTRMGLDDLGYVGNIPNFWDGVPEEVLEQHGVAYEPEWLAKCIDHEQREVIAEWDEDGNLLN